MIYYYSAIESGSIILDLRNVHYTCSPSTLLMVLGRTNEMDTVVILKMEMLDKEFPQFPRNENPIFALSFVKFDGQGKLYNELLCCFKQRRLVLPFE